MGFEALLPRSRFLLGYQLCCVAFCGIWLYSQFCEGKFWIRRVQLHMTATVQHLKQQAEVYHELLVRQWETTAHHRAIKCMFCCGFLHGGAPSHEAEHTMKNAK